jgi:hypothetical protein
VVVEGARAYSDKKTCVFDQPAAVIIFSALVIGTDHYQVFSMLFKKYSSKMYKKTHLSPPTGR